MSRDGRRESSVRLQAHQIWCFEERKFVLKEALRLQLLAPEAHDERRSARIGVQADIPQGANRNLSAGRIDGHSAAVGMRQRDDVIDIGKAGQHFKRRTA